MKSRKSEHLATGPKRSLQGLITLSGVLQVGPLERHDVKNIFTLSSYTRYIEPDSYRELYNSLADIDKYFKTKSLTSTNIDYLS